FLDEFNYLLNAAWYSPGAESLWFSALGEHERAQKLAATLKPQDKFTRFAVDFVNFNAGAYYLHCGDRQKSLSSLNQSIELLHISPDLESILIDNIFKITESDSDKLQIYDDIFKKISLKYRSAPFNRAYSIIMTSLAIEKINTGQSSSTVFLNTLRKAYQLDPDNEIARNSIDRALILQETDRIDSAFEKLKINKAAELADNSNSNEVREFFFEGLEDLFVRSMKLATDSFEKTIMIQRLLKYALKVDKNHPLTEQLEDELNQLQG
ncbi:MAG: hypothetical protein U9R69_04005, partial [Thermodesulfobacteriota bacterium]|nr:hypothetical protein [Thermodesulfobacteriota bacterium]